MALTTYGDMALIGLLPGFNQNIDTNQYDFEKELLHNLTFIDFKPVTYRVKFIDDLIKTALNTKDKNTNTNVHASSTLYEYIENPNTINDLFKRICIKYLGLKNIQSVRLIASSDSTFNESFSTQFTTNDLLHPENAGNILASAGKVLEQVKKFSSIAANINKYSPEALLSSYEKMSSKLNSQSGAFDFLSAMFEAQAFGVDFALPEIFTSTSYQPTYSIFFKLTSPTGHFTDVKNFIIDPLILLMIMTSPISFNAITYGFPFLWKIKGYGNITFNIGAIESMMITRGSMETSYSDDLLPLTVDVRLTVRSLSQHFASVIESKDSKSTYLNNKNIENNFVGMYTPYQEEESMSGTKNDNKIVQTIQL